MKAIVSLLGFLVGSSAFLAARNRPHHQQQLAGQRTSNAPTRIFSSMEELAREWAVRNADSDSAGAVFGGSQHQDDSYPLELASQQSTYHSPDPMEDLAKEWAARNRDSDDVYYAQQDIFSYGQQEQTVNDYSAYSSANGFPQQPASYSQDNTDQQFLDDDGFCPVGEEDCIPQDSRSIYMNTRPYVDVTMMDKKIYYNDTSGRFYESEAAPIYSSQPENFFDQVSVPKRTTDSHFTAGEIQRALEQRNTLYDGDARYSVEDSLFTVISEDAAPVVSELMSEEERQRFEEQIESLKQPRPYPVFLAEKGAEIVGGSLKGLFKSKSKKITPMTPGNYGKKRIVILGSGWGATAFLKEIDANLYDVTVISPRNHFVFTPMLAGSSTGSVEPRSIVQPIREVNLQARYLEGIASEVDPLSQTVLCESVICDGNSCDLCEFSVKYDILISTVGAQSNTFGTPGVREYCNFLKTVEDAQRIRTAIVNCFERANLPGLTDEEREHNLTFVVIGAGPTGIEFAGELRDFVEQDGPRYYPELIKYVRIKVIASSSTILNSFEKSLQDEAIRNILDVPRIRDPTVRSLLPQGKMLTKIRFDSRVVEVTDKLVILKDGTKINYGLALWAAGNGPIPLTLQMIEALGDAQAREQEIARGRIAVDPWLRAIGGKGKILAFGDCSCILQGGQQLPATAQVASQQGEYLGSLLNRKYDLSPPVRLSDESVLLPPMRDPKKNDGKVSQDAIASNRVKYAKPFQFLNLGILAYTGGDNALAQIELAPEIDPVKGVGKIGNILWRSVYLSKQVSLRNRLLVLNDWLKKQLFGRDITRV